MTGAVAFLAAMVTLPLAGSIVPACALLFVAGLGIAPTHPFAISASGAMAARDLAQPVVMMAGYVGLSLAAAGQRAAGGAVRPLGGADGVGAAGRPDRAAVRPRLRAGSRASRLIGAQPPGDAFAVPGRFPALFLPLK